MVVIQSMKDTQCSNNGDWGLRVVVIVASDDSVRRENGRHGHDPPHRKWGIHGDGGWFGPGEGGRGQCLFWARVGAAGPSVVA